uniref:Protein BRICK1 n=1 Tax=Rhabditophanes sp. KR3021 TaxID=114890 RepID=A0AC35TIC9_9BILA
MNSTSQQSSVQRQLLEDWDNRAFIQVISDKIKETSNFLSQFEISCHSKLASLNDKLVVLEKKIEFLEGCMQKIRVACEPTLTQVPL